CRESDSGLLAVRVQTVRKVSFPHNTRCRKDEIHLRRVKQPVKHSFSAEGVNADNPPKTGVDRQTA
ncbi:MAG TPA: hypothetical protein VJB62_02990, partial [Patescibacteria group bacterium]|nr:hypothetical protein [Patescibacteria group bacterium]